MSPGHTPSLINIQQQHGRISETLPLICRAKLVENYSKPSVANFGRSLLGGYCPTYVPDFVLHGMQSDDKLRQNLTAELAHAVQVRCRAHRQDGLGVSRGTVLLPFPLVCIERTSHRRHDVMRGVFVTCVNMLLCRCSIPFWMNP